MAKLPEQFGKIKQSELEKFFTKYGDSGALESAFTTSPDVNIAARNFGNNWRQPGMAEEPIPGAAPTDLSRRLEPVPWLVNMAGEGPRNQQIPASVQSLGGKRMIDDVKFAMEQERVKKIILTNKELAGQDPAAWTEKGILDLLKTIKNIGGRASNVAATNKSREGIAAQKGGGGAWKAGVSTGTAKGGGVAPAISAQDKAAFDWAKQNPNDPRATGIMLKLKQKGL